jgi:hypothetical protein
MEYMVYHGIVKYSNLIGEMRSKACGDFKKVVTLWEFLEDKPFMGSKFQYDASEIEIDCIGKADKYLQQDYTGNTLIIKVSNDDTHFTGKLMDPTERSEIRYTRCTVSNT